MGDDPRRLTGLVAAVTGASSGIGRAIAVALAREGADVWAIGRNAEALAQTVGEAEQFSQASSFTCDLSSPEDVDSLIRRIEADRLDILVHSAGVFHSGRTETARVEDLDSEYAVNVRAPYQLTQGLMAHLVAARGQVVFINSSAGLDARHANLGQYSATKHALKALADSLREELNPKGVRVLSVFPGRTATPMQEDRFREEGRTYHPELLLQPDDVAMMVMHALSMPRTAEVTGIHIRPMQKSY
ncbi:MAG TPA: SDR family oxidoreductase [Terriglobia bacterium]|nr:SDR family oxidoreductase [Terriglobia bacterium]